MILIRIYTSQSYGLSNQLIGLEGVLKVLEERDNLESEIYNSLKIDKIRIDNSDLTMSFTKLR